MKWIVYYLEIRVLVHLAASETRNLSDSGQIDKGVVGDKQIDSTTESGAFLTQLIVKRRLGRKNRFLFFRAQQFALVSALQTSGSFGDGQRRMKDQQFANAFGRFQSFQSGLDGRTENRFRLSGIGKHGRYLDHQLVNDILRLDWIAKETVQQRHKHILLPQQTQY